MAGVEGERELEDFLTDVFEGRSDGQADPEPEPSPAEEPAEEPEPAVYDRPDQPVPPPPEPSDALPSEPTEELPPEPEEEGDPALAWAKKKYGDDPDKWARAAFQQEQHISRLAGEKKQAEEYAQQMFEYAQYAEQQAVNRQQEGMPLSAQEETWIEQGLSDPVNYAYTALIQGNQSLFNGLLERIAQDNPGFAANVGAQAQMAVQQQQMARRVQADQQAQHAGDFPSRLGESLARVGIDPRANDNAIGNAMSEKIGELGEYHPYVQTIMHSPDPGQRDLAIMAVYDLVRAGQTATRRARESDREAQIRREGELRREAASVVTGSPHAETKKQSPFMQAMEDEWRRRGQWPDDAD